MYALDRADIEEAAPGQAPTFFEVDGQLHRITRIWPEFHTLGYVAIIDDRIVGLFLLEEMNAESATVGYYVAAARRRAGIATRGLARLVEIAFGDVGPRAVIADIEPHNMTSLRVVDRNGFCDEGTVNIESIEHRRFVLRSEAR